MTDSVSIGRYISKWIKLGIIIKLIFNMSVFTGTTSLYQVL